MSHDFCVSVVCMSALGLMILAFINMIKND